MQHQLAPPRAAVVADKQDWQKTIVLNAPALAVLTGLSRIGEYVIAGTSVDSPRSDLKMPWKAVSTRAGLTGVRIHDLRHTHALEPAPGSGCRSLVSCWAVRKAPRRNAMRISTMTR
jgi:integrase